MPESVDVNALAVFAPVKGRLLPIENDWIIARRGTQKIIQIIEFT
jgi:hypothetical protein